MHAAQMLLIAVCLLASGHLPAGEIGTCGHGRVELEASTATATDLRLACEAVSHGVGFLRARGVEADATLRIRVVDELPSQHGVISLGQFDPTHSEIRVLSLTDFRAACADDPPFEISLSPEIYRSFIVHEVVHAVTHVALAGRAVRRLDMEYLAYVAQLTSLPDDLRAQLIAASDTEGFERAEQINAFVYFADPNRFGIMSYLHYQRPENGDRYLRKILGRRSRQ